MIDRNEVLAIATARVLRPDMIEKDYVLGWMLAGIFAHPAIGSSWTFKGGTCLKKCFLETYRLSEDLDFTVEDESQLDAGFLTNTFAEVSEWIYDHTGINASAQQPRFRTYRNQRGGLNVEGRIYYRGPLQARGSPPRVKLDLTSDERMVQAPVQRQVAHLYTDGLASVMFARCYSLAELMGEKIRALGERARPRDLYDVVHLFWRDELRPDPSDVLQVVRQKCEFKKMPVPNPASLQFFREEMEGDWDAMLGHQLPAIPPIDAFWSVLPGFFTWLHEGVTSSSPEGIPLAAREQVVSGPARGSTLGLQGVADVELVRFAAANRLCIDLSYEGTLVRLEPYSVRRTHDGDVVLYGCETDSPSYGRYRTENIQDVEVTSQPFVPRYANELAALDG